MQDMLSKIIEMDEKARKINEQAQLDLKNSEEEIGKLKQQIYDDYIERAKDRIEKNIAVDKERAEERREKFQKQIAATKAQLQKTFDENREKWVDEIFLSVID